MSRGRNAHRARELFARARGVIFDFDGVIADSESLHYRAYAEVFARFGHVVDEAEYYRHWTSLGHGARGEIERHGLDLDPERIQALKRPVFSRWCRDGTIPLFEDTVAAVRRLVDAGRVLAIASGTTRDDIRALLERRGLADCFAAIVGSDTVPEIKPSPAVLEAALREARLDRASCVVVEDAEKGVAAAHAAGMPVVVVRTPQTRAIAFDDADAVLASHAELRRVVEEALSGAT